jgi:hypothetical protein
VDLVHGAVDSAWLGPPWTDHGWAARARWSLASGRSSAQGRRPRCGRRGRGTRWVANQRMGGDWAMVSGGSDRMSIVEVCSGVREEERRAVWGAVR